MLRAAIRPATRAAFARAVHTSRPAAGPSSRILSWAPTVVVAAAGAGIFGWQIGRSGRVVSLDAIQSEPPKSSIPAEEQPAADLLHAKAEEADESVEDAHSSESESGSDKDAAFDPVTGEINWDCPCLGGMAHGPCGQEFRDAFSCFVYSNEEPKGVDCVEKFRAMQDCFRAHPDVYGEELMDDETEDPPEGEPIDASSPTPALATDDTQPPAPPASILTEPQVVDVPTNISPSDVPSQPKDYPPSSSPVLGTNSDTPSKRF